MKKRKKTNFTFSQSFYRAQKKALMEWAHGKIISWISQSDVWPNGDNLIEYCLVHISFAPVFLLLLSFRH